MQCSVGNSFLKSITPLLYMDAFLFQIAKSFIALNFENGVFIPKYYKYMLCRFLWEIKHAYVIVKH